MNKNIAIIIPAYNPSKDLIELVNKIKSEVCKTVVIVNDGSNLEAQKIFEQIKKESIILVNDKNKGKGYSLKKAFLWILEQKKDFVGVITVDADGQHCFEDIKKVADILKHNYEENDEKVILGSRDFSYKKIPIKNKMGNKIASYIFRKSIGVKIKDTQTGLRGIPLKYVEAFLKVNGNRYEYEQNMLIDIVKRNIPFEEINIKAVYNKNKSNFNMILDSYRIIKTILKYIT